MKLSDGKVTACQFLSESVGVCGKLLEQCRRGGKGRLRWVQRGKGFPCHPVKIPMLEFLKYVHEQCS